ncbi:hypothetical protein [Paenibacillus ihumii]|uniref:hypothetical protein n=1 Tax=Paenibacillus ihumii TaxID=687436 RepID=UPI0006D80C3E|nr:hypothetical protein [Paenibacillus ihumii]
MSQFPAALIKQIYNNLPAVIRIDLNNYLYVLDWLQTETNPEIRAHLIAELELIEAKYGAVVVRKKAAQESGQ